jgi:hypothetical protein
MVMAVVEVVRIKRMKVSHDYQRRRYKVMIRTNLRASRMKWNVANSTVLCVPRRDGGRMSSSKRYPLTNP